MNRFLTFTLAATLVGANAAHALDIIGGADATLRDGDFEASVDSSTFSSFWSPTANGGSPTTTTVIAGTYSGTASRGPSQATGFYQDTGYDILALDDSFTLSFQWAGASGWDTADEIFYSLFTTSDDTYAGSRTTIAGIDGAVSGLGANTNNTPASESFTSTDGALTGLTGKRVFVEFLSGANFNNEFGRVDNISLTVSSVPEPGTYALLSGLLALGAVMVRRRA